MQNFFGYLYPSGESHFCCVQTPVLPNFYINFWCYRLLHEVALSNLQPVEMANLGQKLIQKGADPNLPDNRQDTPLHIAVKVLK